MSRVAEETESSRGRSRESSRFRWILLAIAVVVGATVVPVPVPSAGASTDGAPIVEPTCPDRDLEQTFAPLLDPISYFPLPGGGFEDGPGDWDFGGKARIVAGSNQTMLPLAGDGAHSHALILPPGASARSASVCVEGTATVMRFFARSTGLLPGILTVAVTATDDAGNRQTLVSPVVSVLPAWSAPQALFRLPLLGDHLTDVTIEIRSIGLGPVLVDDIYIDPLRQR